MRVEGQRGAAHPHIRNTHTHTHTHTHTGFIICQHFLEVSSLVCVPTQGLPLTLSWSHVCLFPACCGWFLLSLSFIGYHKVKRGKDPYQELSASPCHLVTSHDNIPDLQRKVHKHTEPGWQKHRVYPNPEHCTLFFFNVYTASEWGMFNLTWHVTWHSPFKKRKRNQLITFIASTRRLYQTREALCHWSRHASWGLRSMSVLSALASVALFFWLANCPTDCQTLWWQIRTDKKRNYMLQLQDVTFSGVSKWIRRKCVKLVGKWFIDIHISNDTFIVRGKSQSAYWFQIHANTMYESQDKTNEEGITQDVKCQSSAFKWMIYSKTTVWVWRLKGQSKKPTKTQKIKWSLHLYFLVQHSQREHFQIFKSVKSNRKLIQISCDSLSRTKYNNNNNNNNNNSKETNDLIIIIIMIILKLAPELWGKWTLGLL